jgi:pimeloyl-ACP methyl ester carboxylesterase
MILIVLAAIAVLYLGVMVIMYFLQPGMLYFPSRTIALTPENTGLKFEDITLTGEDGLEVNGWFIPVDSARATLLFCHGNGGNISHRLESIQQFHRLGLSVFIFDYHGYGRSGGKPGEQETYLDAKAAWKYLTESRGIDPETIIIFGRSLGGAVAIWLANQYRAGALIVESAFLSIPDIAAHYYPFLPVKLLARYQYNSRDKIGDIEIPKLIIHSPDDDIIPFKHGRKLFELAPEPKQFLQISGSHNDGFLVSDEEYRSGIDSFLKAYGI